MKKIALEIQLHVYRHAKLYAKGRRLSENSSFNVWGAAARILASHRMCWKWWVKYSIYVYTRHSQVEKSSNSVLAHVYAAGIDGKSEWEKEIDWIHESMYIFFRNLERRKKSIGVVGSWQCKVNNWLMFKLSFFIAIFLVNIFATICII